MVLLIIFAFVAGAGTALSPCVLPVLPAVLSAGVTGGRRRPLGVATGLALSFTFATVGLVYVLDALGLPDDFSRNLAIVVLFSFGLLLLIPPLSDRVEAYASRLTGGPRAAGREGFFGGLLLGGSLGFVYAPCAGPILSAVVVASASQAFTIDKLLIAFAYSIGSAVVIYALLLGGRRVADRLAPVKGRVNFVMGALMIAVALLLATNVDTKFESWLARTSSLSFFSNPTESIESAGAVQGDLSSLRSSHSGIGSNSNVTERSAHSVEHQSSLPILGRAPDFTGTEQWFNTPGGKKLTLAELRGKVVLVDFWTYTCINCQRTLPYVEAWYKRYKRDGLVVVGVHTPEFPFEKIASNVQGAISDDGLTYPVAQDNEYGTWNAWGNQYWPAKYLIDPQGRVRFAHFGEGKYGETESAIRSLLAERKRHLGGMVKVNAQVPSRGVTTPESYLGGEKGRTIVNTLHPGVNDYSIPSGGPPKDGIALGGRWDLALDSATGVSNSELQLNFGARRVFLVLGSRGGVPRQVQVLLDGRPISAADAGDDVHNGTVTVTRHDLYDLVDLPKVERHTLTLRFAPGVSGYAFTFG